MANQQKIAAKDLDHAFTKPIRPLAQSTPGVPRYGTAFSGVQHLQRQRLPTCVPIRNIPPIVVRMLARGT